MVLKTSYFRFFDCVRPIAPFICRAVAYRRTKLNVSAKFVLEQCGQKKVIESVSFSRGFPKRVADGKHCFIMGSFLYFERMVL